MRFVCFFVVVVVLLFFKSCLFPRTTPWCSNPGVDFFSRIVFDVSSLSVVFECCHCFFFCSVSIFYFRGSLSCVLSFLCVLYGQLSDFLSLVCLQICFVFSLNRETSPANFTLVKCSPSTLILSNISAFLTISSITADNSSGEIGSLRTYSSVYREFIRESERSKRIFAVA